MYQSVEALFVRGFPYLPCRVELESMRDRVQHEEVGRAGLIQELDALRERHQSEVMAREHAHKLAK